MLKPQLYDTIELITDLPEQTLRAGHRGAIVHQHTDELFEVEFVGEGGETLALCPISSKQFIVVWQAETEAWVSITDQIAQIVTNLSETSRTEVRNFAQFLTIKERSQPLTPA